MVILIVLVDILANVWAKHATQISSINWPNSWKTRKWNNLINDELQYRYCADHLLKFVSQWIPKYHTRRLHGHHEFNLCSWWFHILGFAHDISNITPKTMVYASMTWYVNALHDSLRNASVLHGQWYEYNTLWSENYAYVCIHTVQIWKQEHTCIVISCRLEYMITVLLKRAHRILI